MSKETKAPATETKAPETETKVVPDNEFEAALKENDNEMTPEELAALEKQLNELDESEQEAIDISPDPEDSPEIAARKTIRRLVRDTQESTPDSYVVWGAHGHTLTIGHLRALVRSGL